MASDTAWCLEDLAPLIEIIEALSKAKLNLQRIQFGVASALAVFQRAMDTILQGAAGVMCYLDDILVTGVSNTAHVRNLEEVLTCLKEYGVRLRKENCHFFRKSVDYLGHTESFKQW